MALPAAAWTARRTQPWSAEAAVTVGLVVIVSVLVLVPLVMVVFGAARESGGFSLRPLLTVLGSTTIIGNTLMMGLGATLCSPKKPACALCPWSDACAANARRDAETFPRKAGKRAGKLRRGAAFVALRADGRILLRQRPAKGLLGGMTEVPTSEWTEEFDAERARKGAPKLTGARWQRVPGMVTHTFTHFPLELAVHVAKVAKTAKAPAGMRWVALTDLAEEALPSVMRKVVAHAIE